jgi:hypothetical protein
MKKQLRILVTLTLCLSVASVYAQFGPRQGGMGGEPHGPKLGGSTAKLFGNHTTFTANLELQTKDKLGERVTTMPGKIAFASGKSRFEMDMSQMKGGGMPPQAAAQMKEMGMDRMVTISRPDKKLSYLVYPGMQAYAEMAIRDPDAAAPESDYKVELTELGKETIDGHPCVKNKAVVTDKEGGKHESLVWNATDMKNFPIKIEQTERDVTVTMLFQDIKFGKPEASLFDPPADFKRYESVQELMQQEMMKRMGGGMGMPARPR